MLYIEQEFGGEHETFSSDGSSQQYAGEAWD